MEAPRRSTILTPLKRFLPRAHGAAEMVRRAVLLLLLPDVVQRRVVGFFKIRQMSLFVIIYRVRDPCVRVVFPKLPVNRIGHRLLRVVRLEAPLTRPWPT